MSCLIKGSGREGAIQQPHERGQASDQKGSMRSRVALKKQRGRWKALAEGLEATHPARRGSPVGGWMDPDMQRTAIRQAERPVATPLA